MKSFAILAAAAALCTAQTIDPSTVPLATRNQWCTSQRGQCPLICTQVNNGKSATTSNSCDPKTLAFSCVCISGVSPNISEYSLTIPYFECTEANNQCVTNCGGNSACQSACRQNNPCGAQDPTRVNTSTITSTVTSSGSASTGLAATTTGFDSFGGAGGSNGGSASQTASSRSGAQMTAISIGQTYGLGVVLAGIAAGFGLML